MSDADDLLQRYSDPEADPDYLSQMQGVGQIAGAAVTGLGAQMAKGWGDIAGQDTSDIHGTSVGPEGQRLIHSLAPTFKPVTDAASWLGDQYGKSVDLYAGLASKYLGTPAGGMVAATGAVLPNLLGPAGEEKTIAEAAESGVERGLTGMPREVDIPGVGPTQVGPDQKIRAVADQYMKDAGINNPPQPNFLTVDPAHGKRVAQAYEAAPHAPNDPAVKASYDALIKETHAQYQAIKNAGLNVEFIPHGAPDPYAASPRLATEDITKNNHFWVFPTSSGFGAEGEAAMLADHPMLGQSGETISGQAATNNDLFRVVHDYFGHAKEGVGFRANGEENAWAQHSVMYSDAARPAMTAETRGQNSWVNHGPYAEQNRTASGAQTVYAPQKATILPDEFNSAPNPYDQAAKSVLENKGVTMHPHSGTVNPDSGYAVSVYPGQETIVDHPPSSQELQKYVADRGELFANDPQAHLGVWEYPKDSGQHYMDMSHVEEDPSVAMELGKEHKQLEIFDLAHGQSIPVAPGAAVKLAFEHANPEEAPAGYLGHRVSGNTTVELYTDPGDPNKVHLEKIAADLPGQGAGTAAMQQLTHLADRHGATITLDAVPQGPYAMSREKLMAYYQRHGFQPDGNTEASMTRVPSSTQGAPSGDLTPPPTPVAGEGPIPPPGMPENAPQDLVSKYLEDTKGYGNNYRVTYPAVSRPMGEYEEGFNTPTPRTEWTPHKPTVQMEEGREIHTPGVYGPTKDVVDEAAALAAKSPEDPDMERLFGKTRAQLAAIGRGRQGNLLGQQPGMTGRPGGAASVKAIMTPENDQRLVDALQYAMTKPELADGMIGWYVTDPAYDRVHQIVRDPAAMQRLGVSQDVMDRASVDPQSEGDRIWDQLNTFSAISSPQTPVDRELEVAGTAHWMREAGRWDEFEAMADAAKEGKNPPDLRDLMTHIYHNTQNVPAMNKYLGSGKIGSVSMKAPKAYLYGEASNVPEIGHQTMTPVGDTHFAGAVGLLDTRTRANVKGSLGDSEVQEYGPHFKSKVADRVGLESVPAQALLWGTFAPQTGVRSGIGMPKLELMTQEIKNVAQRHNIPSLEDARDHYLMGTRPQ